jgi:hypothetical protein
LEGSGHPFNTYKDLSEEDWVRFVEKCESENFAANNQYLQCLQSQNELDHHLGNTGYARKQRKWQEEDEWLARQGLENPYDKFRGWLGPFMHARSKLTESDDVTFYSQSTSELAQRAVRESREDSNGEWDNDALTKAMQTKEQQGHVYGVSHAMKIISHASASTTPSQSNTSPTSMSLEARLSPSPNPEQLWLSPIRDQSRLSLIQDQSHPSPILELPQKSPIKEQPHLSPPRTQSTPLPALDQMQAKVMKNVRDKSHPQQRKMSSKATKGNKPLKDSEANPKLPIAITETNPKFGMGRLMLTINALKLAGKSCVELHNYYINNYQKGQDIIVSYKESQFLVGNGIFLMSWSDLYDLFNLDVLDFSLIRCFAL